MKRGEMSESLRRILRCVPEAGSGEAVSPREIATRLDLVAANVQVAMSRAYRAGRLVRLRTGHYQLAPRRAS